jgi:hypothetical protein
MTSRLDLPKDVRADATGLRALALQATNVLAQPSASVDSFIAARRDIDNLIETARRLKLRIDAKTMGAVG